MTTIELIDFLSVVVLLLFVVALVYLILLLYRANRILTRLDSFSETFRQFVSELVPAIISVGTVVTAIQGVLRQLANHHIEAQPKKTKK